MAANRTDEDIKRDIIDSLYWDNRVDAAGIGVFVTDGHVRLTGTVTTYRSWRAAREDALMIRGVNRIDTEIDIEVSADFERPTDDELDETLTEVLSTDPDLLATDVKVDVVDGHVTLHGTVPSYWERELARVVTLALPGVRSLRNEVVVVPTADRQDVAIAEDVISALRRNRHIELSHVDVAVANGEVTLSGQVDNPMVHGHVLDAARYATGVTAITDNLRVARTDLDD